MSNTTSTNTYDEDELPEPYLSIVKEKEPDQFIDLLCANNFFAGNLNGKMPVNENRVVFELWLKARDRSIKEQAERDQAANIHKMGEDILLKKSASSIVAGGTELDELLNAIERKYGKDLIRYVYGDHNRLHSTNNSLEEK